MSHSDISDAEEPCYTTAGTSTDQRAVWSNEQTDLNALVMGDFILPIDYLIESLYSTEGLAALNILLG